MRRPASVLGVQIAGTAQRSGKTVRGWGIAGSEIIFPDAGFDQNTVRHLGNVDGKRDLTASEEAGFAKGCGIGKENDVRNIVYRGTGRGILVNKEQECGIRFPPLFQTLV